MKSKKQNPFLVAAISLAGFAFAVPATFAADLTWDTTSGDGATITAASGAWNTTATTWNSGSTNVTWTQTSATAATNAAVFGGTDGLADAYLVTLSGTTNAQSATFNSGGYKLTGGTLTLIPTSTTSGPITVAAGKTATINSAIAYVNNTAVTITVNSGGTLNLGGGASNSQYAFSGSGTVNMTAGTYTANVGRVKVPTFNQSGGTFNITPGNGTGYDIGSTAGQSVNYTLSAGTLSVNGNATTATVTNSYLALGRAAGSTAYQNTLTVQSGGIVNIGTTASRAGELRIALDTTSSGKLDVQGGTVTIGTGDATNNKIYFFKSGSGAGYNATMTQSAGTVTANGIQFGGSTGSTTYNGTSAANLTLSGGSLYVGAQGITKGTDASALPTAIKLEGGTIGASENWSSSLDMKLGTTAGGPTFQAATSSAVSKNITLSGVLSNDTAVAGMLTKTGLGTLTLSNTGNSYTGATTISTGSLKLGASSVLPDTTAISIAAATLDAATFADTAGTLDVTASAIINLGAGATLAFADSSAIDWTGGTLNITGTFVPGSSLRFGTTSGGLTTAQLNSITSTGFSNFLLDGDGYLTVGDSTPPTITSIVDNKDGGQIAAGTVVTYTVTFNEPMDATTISAADFAYAGTASCIIGTVNSVSTTVFTVQVTNTTAGTLILQIPTSATITDAIGNFIDCDPALVDDTTITVNTSPAPTLSVSNIVDDKAGQPVAPNMLVTYTLTFSEDIDDATVTSADFGNVGTATITLGAITETSPGVFTVQVTPTSTGTLQFKVNANAVIRAAASNNVLDTSSAIVDADTTTVGNNLFWDTTSGDGAAITSGTGAWNTTAGNTVWNNVGGNVIWSQTATNDASYAAAFGGADGATDAYVITLATQMAAESLTLSSSGYKITGSTLALMPTTATNGTITVAAGKTATINSALAYANNVSATITANAGAILNLGGGASNSQYNFTGAGTVSMTAGNYQANVGKANVATFNQTGGTFGMNLPSGSGGGYAIGYGAGQSVTYTMSGAAIINANSNADANVNSYVAIGRASGNTTFTNTLNVQGNANLNVGNTSLRSGELHIAYDTNSSGTLNVSGTSAVTVGTGTTANKIYFFKAGSGANYTASMTQSAGTVTANGIQFGGSTGLTTYNGTSAANLTLSGGSLYIGLQGITRGSDASALPVAIKLQGGTIGASDTWSSSLDIKLGSTGSGPTFQAATSGAVSKNITLSGVLSNDAAVNGTLTKTGVGTLTLSGAGDNTYSGATAVNAGTLNLGKVNAVSSSSSLTIATGAALALSSSSSTVPNLTFGGTGTLSFNVAAGYSLTVNGTDSVTNSGAAGSITINITGSAPANGTYTLIDYNGALQGSGFSAYTLGSTPVGKSYTLTNDSVSGAVQLVVAAAYAWTGLESSEWSTNVIAGLKNWNKDGSPYDYTNDLAVIFDDSASNKTVEIMGANVTPLSVTFNSGIYTLQGNYMIAGPAPVAVETAATLKLGSSNVLADGVGQGNLIIHGTLDLNSISETINGFSGTGSVDNTVAATTSTLTVGAIPLGSATGTIKNTGGTLALSKTGNSDFILSGTNTYSGGTTISMGRLFISNSASLTSTGIAQVNNGASLVLNASGTPTFAQSITLATGSNLSVRQAATVSNLTLPIPGIVIFNNDDVATAAFTLSTPTALTGALTVQVGGGVGAPGIVTLTGILSGSGGSLVKTGAGQLALAGANTFVGGVTIKNGTLESKTTTTTLGANTVTMGGASSTGASFITGQNNSNPFVINAPDSGDIVIGANGNGSGFIMSGGITLNGNLTLQSYNNPVPVAPATTKAVAVFTGGISGTGNLLLNNLGLAANTISITTANVNHTGSITLQGTATGDTTLSASIGSNVTGITQNSATSPMILSGANSYPGNLTVNAGLVRLSNAPDPLNANPGNDASTVTIAATGATLNLTYTGTDIVDKLVIGSTQQANGVYGKVGSASPVIGISQITGDGTLTVGSATPPGYSSWITGTFANGTVPALEQGPNDDFDKDGISNLVEYAIAGQDPTVGNPTIGTFSAGTLSFTKREGTSGLTYAIQKSTDLGITDAWTEVTGGSYVNDASTISFTLTPGTPAKNFLRLQVLSN
jgi:autotransporter-associated beta strand protein